MDPSVVASAVTARRVRFMVRRSAYSAIAYDPRESFATDVSACRGNVSFVDLTQDSYAHGTRTINVRGDLGSPVDRCHCFGKMIGSTGSAVNMHRPLWPHAGTTSIWCDA